MEAQELDYKGRAKKLKGIVYDKSNPNSELVVFNVGTLRQLLVDEVTRRRLNV